MTFYQRLKYIFIKSSYLLFQKRQDYDIRLEQILIIITLSGEKIKGKVITIDRIEFDGEFIANGYEIQGASNNYNIDDSHILCVFNIG